jgi:hypothetical protein
MNDKDKEAFEKYCKETLCGESWAISIWQAALEYCKEKFTKEEIESSGYYKRLVEHERARSQKLLEALKRVSAIYDDCGMEEHQEISNQAIKDYEGGV